MLCHARDIMLWLKVILYLLTGLKSTLASHSDCLAFIPGENCGAKNPVRFQTTFKPSDVTKGCICITDETAAMAFQEYGKFQHILKQGYLEIPE